MGVNATDDLTRLSFLRIHPILLAIVPVRLVLGGAKGRELIRALAATGEKSVDALKTLLESKDPDIRNVAVRALAGGHATGPWPRPRPEPRPFPN